jgi:hypothetical protein
MVEEPSRKFFIPPDGGWYQRLDGQVGSLESIGIPPFVLTGAGDFGAKYGKG